MKTQQLSFLEFLAQKNVQFTIPVYQRVYAWTKTQCEELFEDIQRASSQKASHFLSMTLYMQNKEGARNDPQNGAHDDAQKNDCATNETNETLEQVPSLKRLDIIDGQQRIATTTIMLVALRDYLKDAGKTITGNIVPTVDADGHALLSNSDSESTISYKDIHDTFLVAQNAADDASASAGVSAGAAADEQASGEQAKLKLIGPDALTLNSLIFHTEKPARASRRIIDNYEYFTEAFKEDDFDVNTFWSGVCELLIIAAHIDEADKAQTIFEGLNTKGIPLTAADLVRNYLLVAQTREEQQRLYTEYWQPMEIMFQDDILSSGSLKLNTGLRMWLAIRFKHMCISDKTRTYYYFKRYMETEYDGTVEELLDELRSFCYMWAENYKFNEGRTHCSRFAWAKKGRPLTIAERQVVAGLNAQARRAARATYDKEAHRQSSMAGNEVTALLPNFHRGMI